MAVADRMEADVEARIRGLPGNDICADCNNTEPQWASVTYGILVCLECSGQHRSLGVHLSFVRSVQMDSWKPRQIEAMEKSGGNAKLVEYLKSRGIDKSMSIATKYNTKQAAYFRDRLAGILDGKTEPPPDPGNYDPASGGDAAGAEPLPGETTEEYAERQKKLQEAAKERLRQKFGEGGLGGVGSSGAEDADALDLGALSGSAIKAVGAVGGAVGGAVSGVGSFLRTNVIENEELRTRVGGASETASGALSSLTKSVVETASTIDGESIKRNVGGAVGGVTETASGMWSSLRKTVAEGEVLDNLKKNATVEDGSTVAKGLGWGMGAVGGLWSKASKGLSEATKGISEVLNETSEAPPAAPRCDKGHPLRSEPRPDAKCNACVAKGTRYCCARGCEYHVCIKCFEKPPAKADDEDEGGVEAAPPPEPNADDLKRIAAELGMKLGPSEGPGRGAAAPSVESAPTSEQPKAQPVKPQPKAKEQPKVLPDDDFFAEFDTLAQPATPQPKAQEQPKVAPGDDLFADLDSQTQPAKPQPEPKEQPKASLDDDLFADLDSQAQPAKPQPQPKAKEQPKVAPEDDFFADFD